MLNTKFLEIRDAATFIPVLAIRISGQDGYLARRAGFGETACVYLINMTSEKAAYDPYNWGNRTMITAHEYIAKEWTSLTEGDVIDVEFILGETTVKKRSEREDDYIGRP